MDSNTPTSTNTGLPAANTAETLRALQDRAQTALAAQRARMGQLEITLTEQLDLIEGTVAEQLSTQAEHTHLVDQSSGEIDRLQRELADVQATLAAEREQAASAAATATNRSQQLDQQRSDLDARLQELAIGRRDLEARQQALDDRATQLNARERELRKLQDELDSRSQECARQQSLINSVESLLQQDRADFAAKESALQASQQELTMGETALQTMQQTQLARESALRSAEQSLASREAALQSTEQQLARNQSDFEQREHAAQTAENAAAAERDRLREQVAKLTSESIAKGGELASQLADVRQDMAVQQVNWENQLAELENERFAIQRARDLAIQERDSAIQERDSAAAQLASLSATNQSASNDFANRLTAAEQQLEFQRSTWEGERYQLEVEVRQLSHQRDELAAALSSAGQQLESSRNQADVAVERDELQQKFELALADMQRLRGRVAEMEQELASRPAVDHTDSVELVGLRAERDELARRVAELEQQPASVVDSDSAQQIADLQRRFELAVEDVRDLKKQNAQLETQLAAAKTAAPAAAGPAGGSWEAVKRQLLESLEGEGGEATPERQKQISSMENTVRITDEVVANKDRQIAELKSQLASGAVPAAAAPTVEIADEVLDADAVIQKHRTRIAQIEQQMEDKLRETEMALSMERAKIAREQAQLTELRIELESMRGPNGVVAEPGGTPKRRWLSKLGLGDDEKK